MDGQDKQDKKIKLSILLILSIHVNSFRTLRAADLPCPYSHHSR
jgi:hypothetical protein